MSAFLALNGFRAISGTVSIPQWGPWSADIVLATSDPLVAQATVTIGDLTLSGTIIRMASFAGSRSARVVAGGGGWRKIIPGKGYAHDAGVKLSSVLNDAAREAGEQISVADDRSIGASYTRKKGQAGRALRLLIGSQWWIDPHGVTQTKVRDATPISSAFTVVGWSGGKGRFEIATEKYSDWMPGRTFTAPTVKTPQTISSVTLTADNDGKLRLDILAGQAREDRLTQQIRDIVRDELATHDYCAIVEYEVTKASEMKIDCKPTDPGTGWPMLSDVPLRAGLLGEVVTPTVGKKAMLGFLNADPTRVVCVGLEGISQKSAFDSSGDIVATAGGLFKVNGAGDFVALAGLVKSRLDTIQAAFDAHVHPTGVGPSGPPPPIGPLAAVACTKLKTD